MSNKAKTNIKLKLVNFIGTAGYFSAAMQWFWAIILYFSLIDGFAKLITPAGQTRRPQIEPVVAMNVSPPSPLQIIFMISIVAIMIVITVYLIWKIPSIISRTSKKVVHDTADKLTTVVLQAQNKPVTKKNVFKLSANIVIVMKMLLVVVPVILSYCSVFLEKQVIEYYIAIIITIWLASFGIVFFAIQYFLVWALGLKKQDIW